MTRNALNLFPLLLLAPMATAQIPDGWYVYGAFNARHGPIGVYLSHPRNPGTPTEITNLQGDLKVTGASCIVYRRSDGAILVGERAPTGSSVDLHVIWLNGTSVMLDASFSMGTGGSCCGEIPQIGLLPDGRVVVAATDLSAGPLQNILTTNYGWQGVGIVDTRSGMITPIPIANGAAIVDVFNGLAVSPDGSMVYMGTYVSASQGDIWQVPVTGGTATVVASVPAGLSNLAFDADGNLWVTTLDASQGLFRVDLATGIATQVPQLNGSLNAIVYEDATGNLAALSANAGVPPRSVFWMEPNGTEHLLTAPGFGTLSGIAINPNPEVFGTGTPGAATYDWVMPNPGGLPLVGNTGFGLTLNVTGIERPGWAFFGTERAATPLNVLGADFYVEPSSILASLALPFPGPVVLSVPIPNDPVFLGAKIVGQTLHFESMTQLSAPPAFEFSVL